MEKTLILHGHFYQPPREHPDTGLIPIQQSAYPKENWNVRITEECYAANAYSRYLTFDGRIEQIINNYEYLSFNFGPTLLHWINEHCPDVYGRIIEADRNSISRLGHGNAIAQSFNHTILPLDDPADAELQIAWGLEDFSRHFGRDAEGIWLPETAVSTSVIDQLIRWNIKFIILSPWQAQRVETEPGVWKDLGKQPAPYQQPYIISRPQGEITVFFYHAGLAEGISFGHFLRDAETLYSRIQELFSKEAGSLLHTATDGEIYGHHEPFGDMCLAAMIKRSMEDQEISFGNYASYLEANPPSLQAQLKEGEEKKGTSWSCFHGVSRWYKDCGCSTGGEKGWNQKWRTPLRTAMQQLSEKLLETYHAELPKVTDADPRKLLFDYGKVISGETAPQEFCRSILGNETRPEQDAALLKLLEGQRYRHYMFTSCGWFFSDISGIEPKQNLLYALHAAALYRAFTGEPLEEMLEDTLHQAKSNKKKEGRGSKILRSLQSSLLPFGTEAACYFVLNRELAREEDWEARNGDYLLEGMEKSSLGGNIATIRKESMQQSYVCTVVTEFDRNQGMLMHCREESPNDGPFLEISMDMLGSYLCSRLFTWIDRSLERVTDNDLEQIFHDMNYYAAISKQASYQPEDHFFIANMGTCMRTLSSLFRLGVVRHQRDDFDLIQSLLDFIFQRGGSGELETTNRIISEYLNQLTDDLMQSHDPALPAFTKDLLMLIRDSGFVPDITRLQNSVYELMEKISHSGGTPEEELKELAMQTGIVTDRF